MNSAVQRDPDDRVVSDIHAVLYRYWAAHRADRDGYTRSINDLTAREGMSPRIAASFLAMALEVYDGLCVKCRLCEPVNS
jgi:hypothetical protein